MNGHRAYLDLTPDYRSRAHKVAVHGHRTYTNPTPYRRASIREASNEHR